MPQPLEDVRIADFTTAHQGPWATQKLGDMGADVIKIDHEFQRSETGIGQKYLPAPYGLYKTQDGYVAIAMIPMNALAEALELPELAEYEPPKTYEERDEIKRTIESYTRTQQMEELVEMLVQADIWAAQLNDFETKMENPQVEHNYMIIKLAHPDSGTFATTGIPGELSKTPGQIQGQPPHSTEHTEEILMEIGYSEGQIRELEEQGVTERWEE